MRNFLCWFLCALALAVEAGFIAAAKWQHRRYLSAVSENAAPQPHITLTGQFIPSATTVLDNQPNPIHPSRIGWRLLVPFQTKEQTLLIDRGWHPTPPNRTVFPPSLTQLTSASPTTLTVPLKAYTPAHGWLRGPLTAADDRILTRMSPTPIPVPVSTTHFAYEVGAETHLPPPRNPAMHKSYMLQWLGLALAFPLLVGWNLRRRLRR